MGNEQAGISSSDVTRDISQQDLQELYMRYLRNQSVRREEKKKENKIKYTIHDTDEDYMICTNNMYEARIQKDIYKKQSQLYSTFHRKLSQTPSRILSYQYEPALSVLDIPPTFNFHSKVMESMIPNKRKRLDEIDSPVYNILFNQDGSQLLVTTQENLLTYEEADGSYKRGKVLNPRNITWTITDSDLSSSGRYLIHCSLNPFVSIFDIKLGKYSNFYNFNDNDEEDNNQYGNQLRFFSCKYSGDDTKILASSCRYGNTAHIKMFDIERERISDSIQAHEEDINSIAFIDKQNSSVFISGSDDRLVKIWDTRALGPNGQAVGELIGHVAGITHVDSRQDNFYVASNSKDSSVKLWDLRKSESSSKFKPRKNCSFDYRNSAMNERRIQQVRGLSQEENFDNSVQTFRGHQVGKTLMRCHFSPLGPTDRRFIYTASYCGRLFIYDILSNETKIITKDASLEFSNEKKSYTAAILNDMENSPVRDAVWHPQKMEIITTNLRGQLFRWYNQSLLFEEIKTNPDSNEEIESDDEEIGFQKSQGSIHPYFEVFSDNYDESEDEEELEELQENRIHQQNYREEEDHDNIHLADIQQVQDQDQNYSDESIAEENSNQMNNE